ncbi:MAG TPA: FixH family protein [Fulvivirga sp.]|nr:FixH family protein [Fulvivirga sp.]
MNWGNGITLTLILFVVLIATLVVISMRQNISLVAEDYYVQELAYQDQMDRIENGNRLSNKAHIEVDAKIGTMSLSIPDKNLIGEVHFFRPSDAKLDRKYKLQLDKDGLQVFNIKDFEKGFWKVKINWSADGKEFYSEQVVVI